MISRLRHFWSKSAELRAQALRYHFKTKIWRRAFPWIPLPIRLPHGAWWLAYNDAYNDGIFAGIQAGPDLKFLGSYLRPGMTAIDVGGHDGYYSLLMAQMVGAEGRVITFEPSPREFKRLRRNIRLNRCINVVAEPLGIANRPGTRAFFVVNGNWPVRNSLRPPEALNPISIQIDTTTLDTYLARHSEIARIDFIKLDVEGGELEALQGARDLLRRTSGPVILCELNDPVVAECGWQHRALDVIHFLEAQGYKWFGIDERGCLCDPPGQDWICGDFVFIPSARAGAEQVSAA